MRDRKIPVVPSVDLKIPTILLQSLARDHQREDLGTVPYPTRIGMAILLTRKILIIGLPNMNKKCQRFNLGMDQPLMDQYQALKIPYPVSISLQLQRKKVRKLCIFIIKIKNLPPISQTFINFINNCHFRRKTPEAKHKARGNILFSAIRTSGSDNRWVRYCKHGLHP